MKIISGDITLLAYKFDIIIHGCNCFNTMGAGVAKSIRKKFPLAYKTDCLTIKGDKSKLGTISYCRVNENNKELIIVNAYTQYHYWSKNNDILLDYNALRNAFKLIKKEFGLQNKKIAFPRIGAGLAKGNWEKIEKIIKKELVDEDITLINYSNK